MERFEAFSERGRDLAGEDVTEAVARFLLGTQPTDRLDARVVAMELDKEQGLVRELFELGTEDDVRLLVDASQVRCPYPDCDTRIDHEPLRAAQKRGDDPECSDCHRPVKKLSELEVLPRFALSDEAGIEAAAFQVEQGKRPKLRAVILCAILDELKQIRKQMALSGEVTEEPKADGSVYLSGEVAGKFIDWQLAAAHTYQTNYEASSGTVGALMAYQPDLIIYLGIAGSLTEEVSLGDVVVADRVFDYEVGKEKPGKDGEAGHYEERALQQRPSFNAGQWAGTVATTDDWRARIEIHDESLVTEPTVHVEPIAAGSKVVANTDSHTFRLIEDAAPRAVAVEMEGAGFLAATHRFPNSEGLLVRGISDRADDKSASDATGWRHQAAANATAFAFELLYRYKPTTTRTSPGAG